MTEKEKLALIYRVTTGYTHIDDYIIDTPSEIILNESFNMYNDLIKNYRFEDFIHKDHVELTLIKFNLWTIKSNVEMDELDKSLDECKLNLYDSFGMPEKILTKIRRQIQLIKKQRGKLFSIKHSLDEYTIEGLTEHITDLFILSKCILDKNYKNVDLNYCDLDIIMNKYRATWPPIEHLRLLARTDPWRSFWNADKNQFRINGDTQKTLSLFSKMYDNVYDNADRPEQGIIDDDDMLDGWFIFMKKKADKEKKEHAKGAIENKHKNAGEIFYPVNSWDGGEEGRAISTTLTNSTKNHNIGNFSAKEVNEMNDIRGHIIRQKIEEKVKKGPVKDTDIPELKLEAYRR